MVPVAYHKFEAADRAIEAGLSVVVDKCIKWSMEDLSGGLHSAGMNTGIISARRIIGGNMGTINTTTMKDFVVITVSP